MKQSINVAIVGHIDHGKSTFIGRLLYDSGYIKKSDVTAMEKEKGGTKNIDFAHFLDIYQEERENEMTMDTTKRYFETEHNKVMIIDSPGHKEFIQNMLGGVSEAHGAIVIVSCKEGEKVQEQTRRHITLLNILGIPIMAIAVNKMDTVDYDETKFNNTVEKIKEFLTYLGQDPSKIQFVPMSAKEGENVYQRSEKLKWYTGSTIIESIDKNADELLNKKSQSLRLTVQHLDKENKVVFGRVETGEIKVGDEVIFIPAEVKATVKKIEVFGKDLQESKAGDNIGLTITTDQFEKIERGDVGGTLDNKPTARKHAIVEAMLPFDMSLKTGDQFTFRLGTKETKATVSQIIKKINSEDLSFIQDDPLALHEGEVGILKLTFQDPVVVEEYKQYKALGRCILLRERKSFPAIIVENEEVDIFSPRIVCGVSPKTLPHLSELIKKRRVVMLRVNGAFELPDFDKLREHKLPIALDIPGDRGTKKTTRILTDSELIERAIEEKLDYVGLSYVTDDKWIKEVKQLIQERESNLKVIAKVETAEALKYLNEISDAADMILIDRGDLGTAVGYEKVPFYQDKIIEVVKNKGKQILIATEIALSTINNDRPTYADVMQLRDLTRKKVDFIVCAEETTINEDPIKSVDMINTILDFAEACY